MGRQKKLLPTHGNHSPSLSRSLLIRRLRPDPILVSACLRLGLRLNLPTHASTSVPICSRSRASFPARCGPCPKGELLLRRGRRAEMAEHGYGEGADHLGSLLLGTDSLVCLLHIFQHLALLFNFYWFVRRKSNFFTLL
uniref:Uncharacterized protein n=1 Tax=Arundo donax TaxID=35708 RepID=A0A0A9ANY2_ARUDO